MTRSAAARGEFADLERAKKGSSALRARVCSMPRCGCWYRFELGLLGELVGCGAWALCAEDGFQSTVKLHAWRSPRSD